MDFKNKKVLIMGLGLHGGGVEDALFFIKEGATVIITDLKSKEELKPSLEKLKDYNIEYTLGGHSEEDFKNADLIVKNPGVPNNSYYLKIAKKVGAPIYDSMGIFLEYADSSKLVGITGTKGKSSVATILHKVLKEAYDGRSYLTGIPGGSPLSFLNNAKNDEYGVLELSSWRLEGIDRHKKSPHIALITNIQEDHLNRYPNYEAYRKAKKIIFKYQSDKDYLVLNYDDEYLRSITGEAPSNVMFYSVDHDPQKDDIPNNAIMSACIYRNDLYIGGKKVGDIDKLGITSSVHYMENVLAVLAISTILNISAKKALSSILATEPLSGRMEHVTKIEGIDIYNDTTATNPFSTLRSIQKFKEGNVVLILGGEDKNLNYKELAQELKNVFAVALLPGSASDKIEQEIKEGNIKIPRFQNVATLREALWWGYAQAPSTILLSPAAASFNMFKNEFDRGDRFAMQALRLESILNLCK